MQWNRNLQNNVTQAYIILCLFSLSTTCSSLCKKPYRYCFENRIDGLFLSGGTEEFCNSVKNGQEQLEEKLKEIVGLDNLKASLREFLVDMYADKFRRENGFVQGYKRPVLVFRGNPGTGKTSVAQLVAGTVGICEKNALK